MRDNTRIEILENNEDRSTFIAYINVGRLPKARAKEYIEGVSEGLKKSLQIDDKTRFLVTLPIVDIEYNTASNVEDDLEDATIVFSCAVCEHVMPIGIGQTYRRHLLNMENLLALKCPNCGERGDWKLLDVKN